MNRDAQAEGLVLSLRDLFQVVFEMSKKQEAETTSDDADRSETDAVDKSDSNDDHNSQEVIPSELCMGSVASVRTVYCWQIQTRHS